MKEMLIDNNTTLNCSMKKQLFNDLTYDLKNWKDPIRAVIPIVDFAEYNAACLHFTGKELKIIDFQDQRVGVECTDYE